MILIRIGASGEAKWCPTSADENTAAERGSPNSEPVSHVRGPAFRGRTGDDIGGARSLLVKIDCEMADVRRILVGCQYVLCLIGILALGHCALTLARAKFYQHWAYRQLQTGKVESNPGRPDISNASGDGQIPPLAEIEIPRVHISAMVAEGASSRVLRIAVGHVPGTALPGQEGNAVLAGHRDTFFRGLGDVRAGDVIKLTTSGKQYQYRVRFTGIVGPRDTWVLHPSGNQTLTLVTCYPFDFIGAAPKRFIVRASRS